MIVLTAIGCLPPDSGGGKTAPVIYAATNNGLFISANSAAAMLKKRPPMGLGADEVFGVFVSAIKYMPRRITVYPFPPMAVNIFPPFIPVGDKEVLGVFVAGQKIYAACGADGLWECPTMEARLLAN